MDDTPFQADRSWLEEQTSMNPWTEGCARLHLELAALTEYFGGIVLQRQPSEDAQPAYRQRFWRCWSYHWQEAIKTKGRPVNGFQGLKKLQARRGFSGRGRYKEDLLQDVFLAEAVFQREEEADLIFRRRFERTVLHAAGRVPGMDDDEDAWIRFFHEHLVPPLGTALQTYIGKGALKRWLGIIAYHFFVDHVGKPGPVPPIPLLSDEIVDKSQSTESVVQAEALEVCLARLSARERLAIQMLAEGHRNKDIASILGLSHGQTSRIINVARSKMRSCMEDQDRG